MRPRGSIGSAGARLDRGFWQNLDQRGQPTAAWSSWNCEPSQKPAKRRRGETTAVADGTPTTPTQKLPPGRVLGRAP